MKSAFPAGVFHAGVADIIGKSLSGQIDSIKVCPGGIIRVWTRSPKGPMRKPAPYLLMTFVVKFYVLPRLPMF